MPDERSRRFVERLDQQRFRPLAEQLEAEVAPFRDLTPAARAAYLEAVCDAAWKTLCARSDFQTAAAFQEPRPPDSVALWQRLMARRRGAQK